MCKINKEATQLFITTLCVNFTGYNRPGSTLSLDCSGEEYVIHFDTASGESVIVEDLRIYAVCSPNTCDQAVSEIVLGY